MFENYVFIVDDVCAIVKSASYISTNVPAKSYHPWPEMAAGLYYTDTRPRPARDFSDRVEFGTC